MDQVDPSVFIVLSDKGWILEKLASDIARLYPNAKLSDVSAYGTDLRFS